VATRVGGVGVPTGRGDGPPRGQGPCPPGRPFSPKKPAETTSLSRFRKTWQSENSTWFVGGRGENAVCEPLEKFAGGITSRFGPHPSHDGGLVDHNWHRSRTGDPGPIRHRPPKRFEVTTSRLRCLGAPFGCWDGLQVLRPLRGPRLGNAGIARTVHGCGGQCRPDGPNKGSSGVPEGLGLQVLVAAMTTTPVPGRTRPSPRRRYLVLPSVPAFSPRSVPLRMPQTRPARPRRACHRMAVDPSVRLEDDRRRPAPPFSGLPATQVPGPRDALPPLQRKQPSN